MILNLRQTNRIPNRIKVCMMCGREILHCAIVTVDRDGDGKLTEKDAVWVPYDEHKAACGLPCAASPTKIPDKHTHGFKGGCLRCKEE